MREEEILMALDKEVLVEGLVDILLNTDSRVVNIMLVRGVVNKRYDDFVKVYKELGGKEANVFTLYKSFAEIVYNETTTYLEYMEIGEIVMKIIKERVKGVNR